MFCVFKLKGFKLLTYINNGWKKIVKNVPIRLLRNKLYPDSGAFSYLDDYIDHSFLKLNSYEKVHFSMPCG
jgi:hypothetical protein